LPCGWSGGTALLKATAITVDEVPVMRVGANLLVPLRGELEDSSVERIEREVTRQVADTRATGVLVDVSGLAVVDSYVARVIARLAAMIGLLGAQAAVVGIQPAVAIALVELGVPMGNVHTALNAEQGMARLRRLRDEHPG
jgi:rsbT antagonist protein RsbS